MTRHVRIAALGSLVALVVLAIYFCVWWGILVHRLGALNRLPGVTLTPTPYCLVPVPLRQKVDIGYATFSLPAGIPIDPVQVGPDCAIVIGAKNRSASNSANAVSLFLNLPQPDNDPGFIKLAAEVTRATGTPVHDPFEFWTKAISARPLSAWDLPRLMFRENGTRALLLTLKAAYLTDAKDAGFGTSDRVGFIVVTHPRATALWIEDFRSKTFQNIAIFASSRDVRSIISAIVSSYETHLASLDEEAIKRQIRGARILSMP
jgi:hypothetical protein